MIEIKNPVSRELTGVPKDEYWVQMQQQMFVTGLHMCDFLETTFKEYLNEDEFNNDGTFLETKDGKDKGIIVCFNDGNGPIYKYPKWGISKEEYDKWYDTTLDNNTNLSWCYNTYWYLKNVSCITVPYNKKWLDQAIPQYIKIWDIINKERVEGYDHRKPKTRNKKCEQLNNTVKLDTNNTVKPGTNNAVVNVGDNDPPTETSNKMVLEMNV